MDLSNQRWRLNNLYWITDKSGTRTKFAMNWAQEELLDNLHYLNIVLKARQLGFTTFIQIYQLDCAVFFPDTKVGVIAHTKADAEVIFRDKIKFAYDSLPESIRVSVPVVRDNATSMELANGSTIRVGTSHRSGTLQYLHVSEFGKICAKYPDKAREVVTGALNTIEHGQIAFIESTAEGQEGRFYDLCQDAMGKARLESPLTDLDWKFHFFPWWREPSYALDADEAIPQDIERYFDDLQSNHGIACSHAQRLWYAKKAELQLEDMKREYPSTPEEAFEASLEGAYFARQLARAELDKRITEVPWHAGVEVETWWDLGWDDATAIWFVQRIGDKIAVIDYLEASEQSLGWYARELKERDYVYSRHVLPHDVDVHELGTGKSRKEMLEELRVRPIEMPRSEARLSVDDGIEAVRAILSRCYFDKAKCAGGLKAMRAYRKDWDEKRGVWMPRPRHDWASHAADAFRTGATADDPIKATPLKLRPFGAV